MEIKDIRQFMAWCAAGPSTYLKRKAMFEERKAHMEAEIAHINRALDMLKFKCWYFVQAIAEVYLRQYVARLLLSRFDIIFIPTTLHASLFFHRCPAAPSRQSGFSHTGSARPAA